MSCHVVGATGCVLTLVVISGHRIAIAAAEMAMQEIAGAFRGGRKMMEPILGGVEILKST